MAALITGSVKPESSKVKLVLRGWFSGRSHIRKGKTKTSTSYLSRSMDDDEEEDGEEEGRHKNWMRRFLLPLSLIRCRVPPRVRLQSMTTLLCGRPPLNPTPTTLVHQKCSDSDKRFWLLKFPLSPKSHSFNCFSSWTGKCYLSPAPPSVKD